MVDKAKNVWPDSLMIRDTQLHDDMGGAGQRIYTTAGQGYEKRKYVRADVADELAALRAEYEMVVASWKREELAWEAEGDKLRARVAELQRNLMYAEDAAQKGRLARENAAGMELRIAELEKALLAWAGAPCPCGCPACTALLDVADTCPDPSAGAAPDLVYCDDCGYYNRGPCPQCTAPRQEEGR
jgi:hypothetical protein